LSSHLHGLIENASKQAGSEHKKETNKGETK
jgi:hypothetical protein